MKNIDLLNLIVGCIAIYYAIKSYRSSEKSIIQTNENQRIDIIKLSYNGINELLTCPMTYFKWIGICDVVAEIEKQRSLLTLQENKNIVESLLTIYRIKYYDRIFSLPAGAYIDGQYDLNDDNFNTTQEKLDKIRTIGNYSRPIAGNHIIFFLWQHFKFPKERNNSYSKKTLTFENNKSIQKEFENAALYMKNWQMPIDAKFRISFRGLENGFASVYETKKKYDNKELKSISCDEEEDKEL
jgi:hypothetical protein